MHKVVCFAVTGFFALSVAGAPVWAQPTRGSAASGGVYSLERRLDDRGDDASTARATGRTLLAATGGAVVGGVLGALIGASTASSASPCRTGDPDGCLGAQLPKAIWGTGIGITVGTPLGAHFGNRSRGNLAYTLLASAALFAGEVAALGSLVEDGRTQHKRTVVGIAVAVPVLQIAASTVAERVWSGR